MKKSDYFKCVLVCSAFLSGCSTAATNIQPTNQINGQIPAVLAQSQPLIPTKKVVCAYYDDDTLNKNDDGYCNDMEFNTVKTNISWLDEYFIRQIKSEYPDAFNPKPNPKVTVFEERLKIAPIGNGGDSANVKFLYQRGKLATFVIWHQQYIIGAAHGMYHSDYYVMDLQQQKRLTLNDLLLPNKKSALTRLVYQENENWFKEHEFFVTQKDFQLTDNFYLTANDLVFVYPPYDIASYAEGEIELSVPLELLTDIIADEYLQ